ncbi:hypothetical protein [Lysobacter sp. F6437]|uniref:hypothetical protein n=1 Tax=Lysobacter sp. F6437 TaxID=3459296 RepID=UPI00403D802B
MPHSDTGATSAAGPSAPPALAAFLRGVERRGAVLAELQCGDVATGDAALAATMRQFRAEAGRLPMDQWPRRFWTLLLAQPGLRDHPPLAMELDATDCLATLGDGPRAALLLRLAAGLEPAAAAAVLGVAEPTYQLALRRALPRHADGRADPQAWQRLGDQVRRRIKTLPPPRLVRLGRNREAALAGTAGSGEVGAPARAVDRRPSLAWLPVVLWTLLGLCVLGFAATFWPGAARWLDGSARGRPGQHGLPAEAPASRYGAEAGLVTHRDFALLADPEGLAESEQLAFNSWLIDHFSSEAADESR